MIAHQLLFEVSTLEVILLLNGYIYIKLSNNNEEK